MLGALILTLAVAAEAAAAPVAPPVRELAPGVYLQPGGFLPQRGPDGNTVILEGRDGLIVVDTGRHAWHSEGIIAFARQSRRPISAIVNTHWHLDHSSGNGRIKAAYPGAHLYTTNAIDRVLAPGGFLVRNLEGARAMLEDGDISDLQRQEVQIFLDMMAESEPLRPDIVLSHTQRVRIAGRQFDVHVTDGAVTDADVWLYDRRSRIAVIGDLVTLPAPFFETACPARWRAALDVVGETPFELVVPGHGEPMDRVQFDTWRSAYGAFVDCAAGEAPAAECAAAWSRNVASFLAADDRGQRAAAQMAEYYVGYLRQNGGKSPDCLAS